ncbi:hypothetical protein [Mesobacillus selenatarsenatis]|uniref:Uncharacterized protein n=1 Tax=Mesobacillus selenatarsenatis (strain DSM 18680 / JCM 14380 / FERM P-15431 / SF-1) TaxID=1321606 RepID=A0A0A8X6L4_MESS1|nr:hypothetical protein [Mesobacillus selenatarsenatis]GAM14884.1 hypothetical protein SAMD00020551_3038 [Mesobacillus selenatarsenatis SF-1]
MKNKVLRHKLLIVSIFIGWIGVTINPLFDSVTVTSDYDLTNHRLGLPLPVIEQHTSLTPLEDAYPFELGFVSPLEHPTTLIAGNYLILVVTAVFAVYLILFGIVSLYKRIR